MLFRITEIFKISVTHKHQQRKMKNVEHMEWKLTDLSSFHDTKMKYELAK